MSVSEAADLSGCKFIHAFNRACEQYFGASPSRTIAERPSASAKSPAATENTPSRMLNVAVIGCGSITHAVHIPQYRRHQQTNLVYLCDIDPNRNLEPVKRYQCGAMVTDYRTVARYPQIDAVSICMPNDMHVSMVTEFLEAGKAVHCEMPAACNLEGILKMQQRMNQSAQVLLVGMGNRYDSDVALIRRMTLSGQLGEVYHVCINFRSIPGLGGPPTTRAISGADILMDRGVRLLDAALYYCTDPLPVSVTSETFCRLGRDVPAYTYRTMDFGPPVPGRVCNVEDSVTALVRTQRPVSRCTGPGAEYRRRNNVHRFHG